MKNILKVVVLTSIIAGAMTYVILKWRPPQNPDVSFASRLADGSMARPAARSDDERNNIEIYKKYGPGVVNIASMTLTLDFF